MPGSISVSDSFGGLALSYIIKTPTSNAAVWPGITNFWWAMPQQSKNFTSMLLMFDSFPLDWKEWAFPLRRVLFGIWVITGNPDWVLSFSSAVFQIFKWNLMQMCPCLKLAITMSWIALTVLCILFGFFFLLVPFEPWRWRFCVTSKCWELLAHHHSIKSQKTWNLCYKGLRTSDLTKVNTHQEEMDCDMTTNLSGLNQEIVHLWHIVAGNCIAFHF